MKKVTATVLIKDNEVINLIVNDNNGNLNSLKLSNTHFNNVCELYNSILIILKNNGYYTHVYKEFGEAWYNIQVIDLNNPLITSIYGIDETSY